MSDTNYSDITWSVDEETFGLEFYDAMDNLYSNIGAESPEKLIGMKLYFGTSRCPKASEFINVGYLLEDMGERACDTHGEWAEDFPDCTKEAEKELEDFLKKWADDNCTVTFYTVENVQEYIVTEDDVKDIFGECCE